MEREIGILGTSIFLGSGNRCSKKAFSKETMMISFPAVA